MSTNDAQQQRRIAELEIERNICFQLYARQLTAERKAYWQGRVVSLARSYVRLENSERRAPPRAAAPPAKSKTTAI